MARVEKSKFRVPPSALKPQATATASSRVDLPVPFSPTRKVTPAGKRRGCSRSPRARTRREGRQVAVRRDGLAQVDAVDVAAGQWDHLPFSAGDFAAGGGRFRPAGRVTFWMCPESNQRGTKGQAQDGHSRAHIRPPPGPQFYGGRQLGCLSNDRKGAGGSADWSPFYYRCR